MLGIDRPPQLFIDGFSILILVIGSLNNHLFCLGFTDVHLEYLASVFVACVNWLKAQMFRPMQKNLS